MEIQERLIEEHDVSVDGNTAICFSMVDACSRALRILLGMICPVEDGGGREDERGNSKERRIHNIRERERISGMGCS